LRRIKLAINRAKNKIKISENNLKPKLDLNVEISRDFGNIAEGGLSRDSTDTVIGFKFSVPLQRREAKGRLSRAAAELRAARLYEQRVQDQIEVELSNILVDLTTALKLSTLAKDDVTQSSIMVEAEQNKFRLGASDFFLVNIREERAADAEIRAVRAKLNGRIARTSYDAATISLPALGL
jgi:outer membrane protein TolC